MLYRDTQHLKVVDHFAYATGIMILFKMVSFIVSLSLSYRNGCGIIASVNIVSSVALKRIIVRAAFMASK